VFETEEKNESGEQEETNEEASSGDHNVETKTACSDNAGDNTLIIEPKQVKPNP
jgi:hypothetical protein